MKSIAVFLVTSWRRWRLRRDLYTNAPQDHPALKNMAEGTLIPFNGTFWRIASVRSAPCPAVILVPLGETHASKFRRLREMRRVDRILSKDEQTVRRVLAKRAAACR